MCRIKSFAQAGGFLKVVPTKPSCVTNRTVGSMNSMFIHIYIIWLYTCLYATYYVYSNGSKSPINQLIGRETPKHPTFCSRVRLTMILIDPRRRLFALRRNTAEWTSDVTRFHADRQKAVPAVSRFRIKLFLTIPLFIVFSWDTNWWGIWWAILTQFYCQWMKF